MPGVSALACLILLRFPCADVPAKPASAHALGLRLSWLLLSHCPLPHHTVLCSALDNIPAPLHCPTTPHSAQRRERELQAEVQGHVEEKRALQERVRSLEAKRVRLSSHGDKSREERAVRKGDGRKGMEGRSIREGGWAVGKRAWMKGRKRVPTSSNMYVCTPLCHDNADRAGQGAEQQGAAAEAVQVEELQGQAGHGPAHVAGAAPKTRDVRWRFDACWRCILTMMMTSVSSLLSKFLPKPS